MKNITLLTLAVLSLNTALASEKEFHCEARFIGKKEIHILAGNHYQQHDDERCGL